MTRKNDKKINLKSLIPSVYHHEIVSVSKDDKAPEKGIKVEGLNVYELSYQHREDDPKVK